AYLLERGLPFATHGRSKLSHLHPYYDFDNGDFASKAAQVLHRRGRRCYAHRSNGTLLRDLRELRNRFRRPRRSFSALRSVFA
ncbi:MAG: LacI family transcriptional regulator, partial [Pseudomonadota bacterium]